jgi:trans-aconitate 2-methyltransferase
LSDWQPQNYLKFADARLRPALELLAHVPLHAAQRVYDLGCGPGNATQLLVDRFPGSAVTGIDNSPAMLAAARKACPQADYEAGDLASWMPGDRPQLLFSNAAFQWVPDHLAVLERLAGSLAPGGVLAVQMPDNLSEPSHELMQWVADRGPWRDKLSQAAAARQVLPPVTAYFGCLSPLFRQLDIWHVVYNHPLQGADGIISWFASTGLRPYLDPLSESERDAFLKMYRTKLQEAYPAQPDGTVLLRFPRLFILGVRP